jgi:predicted permease
MRESILQDIQFAWRTARKSPGFVLAAAGILALGIGANTAMFSIVSGVLLRPLPYAHPDRLVQLNETDPRFGSVPGAIFRADLDQWRARSTTLLEIATFGNTSRSLLDLGDPERIQAVWCERNLFHMLGAEPLAGRTFRGDDPPDVAVIGESLWRRLGGDPATIGRKIMLDRDPYTVIGVMPASFQFPYRAALTELWIPWPAATAGARFDNAAARLKPDARAQAARAELSAMTSGRRGVLVTPFSEAITGKVSGALVTLLGAVALVLFIACANVANLLLARATRRSHEIAVRAALGAGRGRLVQQLLTESVLLGIAGSAGGLVLAIFGVRAGVALAGTQIPRWWEIGIDWRVFLFLLAAGIGTGIAFGLLPALAAARVDLQAALRNAGGAGRAAGGRWLRDGLVVSEIALSFVLLVSAFLVLRAFLRLQSTPAGLVTDRVLTMRLTASLRDYPAAGSFGRYLQEIEDRVRQIPGVRAAGFIQYLPLQNWGWSGAFAIRGRPSTSERPPQSELRYVSPGYFETLRIPLRRGRVFTERDTADAARVIVINEALARTYFANEDPVGATTDRGVIIGVVGDVRSSRLDRPAVPEIYYSFAQNPAATSDAGISLVTSARTPPEGIARDVRDAIHQVNPRQVVYDIKPMDRVIAASLSDTRLYAWLIGVFAALAAVLAASGVYGVISYAVAARTREFGVRIALGAGGAEILRLVLQHGAAMVAGGLLAGVGGALASGKLLESLVHGASGVDAPTLAAVGAVLAVAALVACLAPARRAMRVDPNTALRCE